MKHWVLIFTLLSVLFSASFDAQARKKFGSKRTGKTEQTQTTQKQQTTDTTTVAKKSSTKKGIMGGILGGLLAGGLIAAMMGDDFEGVQLLEILLLAGIGFMLFKLITSALRKNQARPAMASANGAQFRNQQSYQQPVMNSGAGYGAQAIPMDLPANFDERGFLNAAKDHYVAIQRAWNVNDFNVIAEYLSPELVAEFKAIRAEQGDVQTEVLFVDARIVRASTSVANWAISVQFSGQYLDKVENTKEPINEIWHLERQNQESAPWLIVGTEDLVD
ncbi:Tim44 domain-containing protein [Pseudoalteromonas sp. GB56]